MPHEAPVMAGAARRSGKGMMDLFTLVSIVLCVASVALAIGMFLYAEYLKASSASKIDQLERARAAFEPPLINELTRLDDRMRAASEVLGKHIAPSEFFKMLEQTTIQSVGFSSLNFEATDDKNMAIRMDGVAGSVNAIALQADLFSKGGMLTSPIFSNINRELDGIHFSLSAVVNPTKINYVQRAANALAPVNTLPTSPFGPVPSVGTQTPPSEDTSTEGTAL